MSYTPNDWTVKFTDKKGKSMDFHWASYKLCLEFMSDFPPTKGEKYTIIPPK